MEKNPNNLYISIAVIWMKSYVDGLFNPTSVIDIVHTTMNNSHIFKIHLKTIDLRTRLYGVSHTNPYIIPPKPLSDVYCFKLNFNILNVGYSVSLFTSCTNNLKANSSEQFFNLLPLLRQH